MRMVGARERVGRVTAACCLALWVTAGVARAADSALADAVERQDRDAVSALLAQILPGGALL